MPVIPRFLVAWFTPAPDSVVAEARRRLKSPWIEAVHLLWSAWVFITPLFGSGYTWRWTLITALSYPVFVLLYAKTLLASRRASDFYAVGMTVLCLVLMPVYPAGISYFIFGCVMLRSAYNRRLLGYLWHLLLLNAAFFVVAWLLDYPLRAMLWVPVLTLIIGIVVNVERKNQEKDAALKLSHEEVRRLAATAERERIGRDLHDLLGHTLSLITLKLELSRKLLDRDLPAARREVEEAERVARHALAEVRSAVTGIRAADLAAELASARLLLESSMVHLQYEAPPALSPEIERSLALVIREAATNIARHAQATHAQIAFACEAGFVQLQIIDNGRGVVVDEGNGLGGMRERVSKLGGSLRIESPKGQGTRLQVRVPIKPDATLSQSDTEMEDIEDVVATETPKLRIV